jgi:predicted nucleic acid-binding protein
VNEAVFDRDILADALAGVGAAQAELTRCPRRFISRLTWIDLVTAARADETQAIEGFLGCFGVIDVSEDIARRAAMLRGDRSRRGDGRTMTLGLVDAVVLASAQTSGRILVTRNTRAFPAAMPGIRVPDTL